jgi:hypothetical protein
LPIADLMLITFCLKSRTFNEIGRVVPEIGSFGFRTNRQSAIGNWQYYRACFPRIAALTCGHHNDAN